MIRCLGQCRQALLWGLLAFFMAIPGGVVAQDGTVSDIDPLADEILSGVEKRYASSAFSARFTIESTLKAMQVTDTAAGRLLVKYPGKMRWEYEEPDPSLLISDGITIWMYLPEDQQVQAVNLIAEKQRL